MKAPEPMLRTNIEIMPSQAEDIDNGFCVQGCPHCPHNVMGKKEAASPGRFSESSLELLDEITGHLKLKKLRVGKLNMVCAEIEPKDLPTLPLKSMPLETALVTGSPFLNIDPEDDKSAIKEADKIRRSFEKILGDIRPKDDQVRSLSVGITNPLTGEHLAFKELKKIVLFLRMVFIKIMTGKGVHGIQWSDIQFSLNNNAVAQAQFDKAVEKSEFEALKLAELMGLNELVLGGMRKSRQAKQWEGRNDHEKGIIELDIQNYWEYFYFNLTLRMIRAATAEATRRQKPLYNPENDNQELLLTLMPTEVWVNHNTLYTRDRSLFLDYDEVGRAIRRCNDQSELDLRQQIFALVEEKRRG
jgi:hypothetical protein